MSKFQEEYRRLNADQKTAVDTIEGPVMVVAGPGTGKTQLLSMRVANIMKQTDTAPANILCLTFTDNAARNMRERLETIIGQAAYHVNIHTFHSFGVEVINQNPDFFLQRQLLQQIDELGRYQILRELFDKLPHSNPLSTKVGEEYMLLKDTANIISWLKQNALTPKEFHEIIEANKHFFKQFDALVGKAFQARTTPKQLPVYQQLSVKLQKSLTGKHLYGFPEYATICFQELDEAIKTTPTNGRYAPRITEWRNRWCIKNSQGQHIFKDSGNNIRKLHAVANIYQQLIDRLHLHGLYDFDDMIIETVQAMEHHRALRANLQERYLYILVDEFQDTNKAQLRLLQALGDNPIYEGRPNILTVGDDDQAIYAFQGAEVSNMVAFTHMYKKPAIIALADNYRSSANILLTSQAIASQISDRLESTVLHAQKVLKPKAHYKVGRLEHAVLPSELAQYQWVAEQISSMLQQGTAPQAIAVLAPRHKYLERLVPYLAHRSIPVSYERRENILESPIVSQLINMVRLIEAIAHNQQELVDALVAEVISYEFWEIPSDLLVELGIECYDKHKHWLPTLLVHKNSKIRTIAGWFTMLARRSTTEPLEYILDALMGVVPDGIDSDLDEKPTTPKRTAFVSPMRQYYFSQTTYDEQTDEYLALLGQLSTLRQRLRQWKPNHTLFASDLIEFTQLHEEAKIKIIDTNPHTQTTNAVQVMTVYKAKGLEFDVVFAINAQDEVWGPTSRQASSKIPLPKNLPIAPASDGDNDKLRLLFVALTRAKHSLIVTSYTHSLENKLSPGLSFIGGNAVDGAPIAKGLEPHYLDKVASAQAVEILATDWTYRFRHIIADKPTLFEPILATYKLSVTHLNNFLDVVDGGPDYFFTHNFLRFPEALTPPAAYGDAVHRTLQWTHSSLRENGQLPTVAKIQAYFSDMLQRKHLRQADFARLDERGKQALKLYFQHRGSSFTPQDLVEKGFNNEGVVINNAVLSGKIDKLHFISPAEVSVIDFKTGRPATSWQGKDEYEKIKLHKYKQQLVFYKLLVENSATFKKRVNVTSGELEFIEVGDNGSLTDNLTLTFEPDELTRYASLIGIVWQHIQALSMPNTAKYSKNLKGIEQFEEDLLQGRI